MAEGIQWVRDLANKMAVQYEDMPIYDHLTESRKVLWKREFHTMSIALKQAAEKYTLPGLQLMVKHAIKVLELYAKVGTLKKQYTPNDCGWAVRSMRITLSKCAALKLEESE